jgi:hypothetical protein
MLSGERLLTAAVIFTTACAVAAFLDALMSLLEPV